MAEAARRRGRAAWAAAPTRRRRRADCVFNERVRGRFRRARARRGRVAAKPPGAAWVAIHFRWGDVATGSVDRPNFRTVGLSQLLRAAAAVRRALSARGAAPHIDFYSEGNASAFGAVGRALGPGVSLHLQRGATAR